MDKLENNVVHQKPELLAPAGSLESFHAAVEAGANAVYCGLTDFNARLRAKNFTPKTLSYLLPFAHSRNVKVYITLNTLVKQAELESAIHTLYQLNDLGVDAVIITDPGLISIAGNYFPKLALHASTQMIIHNSAGVHMAERLGMKRVILSRELTMEEITAISRTAKIELELFVHGALCYSISGLCLASSFLGGSSGNRGRCTQVCRRKFCAPSSQGFFFSPGDLEALDYLPELSRANIASLKIEGRMKTPEYVYTVVKAYRMALDNPHLLPQAKELLAKDLARKKTTLFLGGSAQPGTISAHEESGIGRYLGTIETVSGQTITVLTAAQLSGGDRIRIQPKNGFEGIAATVDRASHNDTTLTLLLKKEVACSRGATVYLIGRNDAQKQFDKKTIPGVTPVPFKPWCPFSKKILDKYNRHPLPGTFDKRDSLWIKIDSLAWLDHLNATPCQHVIIPATKEIIAQLFHHEHTLRTWRSRISISLPPFIAEGDIPKIRTLVDTYKKAGIVNLFCGNLAHRALFGKEMTCLADAPLWCLNRAAQHTIAALGFSGFTYSFEDDYLSIAAATATAGRIYLFSKVPLFIARLRPAIKQNVNFTDTHGAAFYVEERDGLFYTLPEKPMCLTHRRAKLSGLGIKNFIIDLSFYKADSQFLQLLIEQYQTGTRLAGSSLFNFKAGLK